MRLDNSLPGRRVDYQRYLPASFRAFIEEQFYERISAQARLRNLKADPEFLRDPSRHIGLYSDHGPVHVRDVACRYLQVLDRVDGALIPKRDYHDLEFMRVFGLHLVYLHDIGMRDFTTFGRFMHPEFAARYVFSEAFDPMLQLLWRENAGNLPWMLLNQFREQSKQEQQLRFRELLSMSVAHSKSKFPIAVLNDAGAIAQHMRHILRTPLPTLYEQQMRARIMKTENNEEQREQQLRSLEQEMPTFFAKADPLPLSKYYRSGSDAAYCWLNQPAHHRLLLNVQDSLRCLRAADALRQRGTVLRTSAGYEIFVDQHSANAIYALRGEGNQELYLLETTKALNAGEANLSSSEFDQEGNLRIALHRGLFRSAEITQRAAYNAAVVIDDIQADTIQSFDRGVAAETAVPWFGEQRCRFENIHIVIEGTQDNPAFAKMVIEALVDLNPAIEQRIRRSVSLQGADLQEVERYLDGVDLGEAYPDSTAQRALVDKIRSAGVFSEDPDWDAALTDVKVIDIQQGTVLMRAGSPAGFVYLPIQPGLVVHPLGGYHQEPASAWVPVGNTGVIRGADRNAEVVAARPLRLLVIPRERYLDYWHRPFNASNLARYWNKDQQHEA